jgi:hypothetical protein
MPPFTKFNNENSPAIGEELRRRQVHNRYAFLRCDHVFFVLHSKITPHQQPNSTANRLTYKIVTRIPLQNRTANILSLSVRPYTAGKTFFGCEPLTSAISQEKTPSSAAQLDHQQTCRQNSDTHPFTESTGENVEPIGEAVRRREDLLWL